MKTKDILFAIFIYVIFPFSSIFMKYASLNERLLYKIILYICSISVLAIFSILWQKLLKKVDLTKAYLFKSTTIIWNVLYGIILFNEKIKPTMIAGLLITSIGIIIVILSEKRGAN